MAQIKPFQNEELLDCLNNYGQFKYDLIVTAEEGIINGGLGSTVLECLADNNIQIPVLRFGLPDEFPCHYGEQQDLLETYGLTPEKMAARIKEFYDAL
jgi:transketolase C-terminal domain/subunit